ncbi:hypothetical protein MSG28_003849 [Choristoneura fumiferana]|uniref:Uncharacterized protein n=1 Tax=Choristoneura fumiferana TaxID=7141 RepID=A0ACC0KHH0_CHOFU|nr:hypothetical protein MSG28_003849 [Choristoneura fumiferana]
MDAAAAVARVKAVQGAFQVLVMLQLTAIHWPEQTVLPVVPAGCVLANRLSESSHVRVLLIEAGGDPPFETMLPGLLAYIPETAQDWNFTEEYDKNRELYQKNLVMPLTQAKMLGGGSSMNYMFYVRGNPHDYQTWADTVDDQSWNYSNILPLFKKSEYMDDPGLLKSKYSKFHGTSGFLHVSRQPDHAVHDYEEMFRELGHKILPDVNGDETLGYGQPTYTIAKGVRQSTSFSFLRPVKHRHNLDVLKNTFATKILFDDSKNAIGVEALTEDHKKVVLMADKEVILSAGALNSPKLLLNSGIGPDAHLNSLGIKVISNLPVGQNLQDHPGTLVAYKFKKANEPPHPPNYARFPLPPLDGFVAFDKDQSYPDYQAIPFAIPNDSDGPLQFCSFNFGLEYDICQAIYEAGKGREMLFAVVNLLHPKSRGNVELQSTNPIDPPLVTVAALSDEADLEKLALALADFDKLRTSSYFKSVDGEFVDHKLPKCGGLEVGSREYWRCHVLSTRITMYHYSGTCAMGSVLDSRLRVRGVQRLRVADGSAMPNITSGNINAPIIMIAEKAAEMIKQDNNYRKSPHIRFVIRTREKENEVISPEVNLTKTEKKDIMEAAEYGMQKMHELYAVMEPKLYSMGLWLDDSNPARYVAAFNAPSEDAAKFYRYGYASLQAAAKLKQLTSRDGLESRTEEAQFPAASALRQSPLLQHCPLRGTPKCPPASKRYRTHDGTCNNLNRPRWGSTMTPVQRFLAPSYSDGIQAPRRSVFGSPLPSAREISSMVHEDQHVETPGITHLLMQWGQFLDHDHPECMPIAVPQSDPFYGPKGVRCLDFVRSSPAPRDDCALGWREQMNQVSAYIDGSPLYASSARQSDKLRLFRNGMLQYGKVQNRRPLLPPERRDELCRGGAVSSDCFKSGDARVNEHPGLVAAHIVWLRQHNRMAQELAHLNPHWSDEKVYQETRKIVGAMIQHITYREFLPIVLGQEVMRLFDLEPQKKGYYTGYSPKINPSPASSFGSAAFRFGHSLVQPSMVRFDRFHRPMKNNVSLHDELTNPSNIWSMGAVDRLLLGMVNQPIQKRDEFITEELTNHLFQTPSYENGGFESSLTPAQLQQIRRISFAQILCRTLDTIDSIQPFVFLSAENIDNDRISCLNGLLNNFDLSPWTDVNSSNDISKSDDISTQAPNETKTTTTKKPTTKKPQKLAANKVGQKKPAPANTYDDTYRRPNKPYYYNRQNDKNENYNLRQNRPNLNDETFSSARSNEQTMTTTKSEATIDKNDVTDNNKPTTENLYKLVTFGYVGTYKGDMANFKETKTDPTHQTIKHDFISKDFSTYEDEKVDKAEKQEFTKLSTFFHYDTATKPYNNVRPTRRNDDDLVPDYTKTNSKYYFVRNVLRKYPDDNSTVTDKTDDATEIKDILKENYNGPGQPLPVTIEERASGDKLALLEEAEAKSANPEPSKLRLKITKPSSPAKTPTVAFQVMPSENNPSQWATYDEKDLPEGLPHRMPPIKTDPYALKEIPRPFNFANLRKRIPGRTRN